MVHFLKSKTYFLCILATSLSFSSLQADVLVQAQAAYYYPTGERFRDIYSGSGLYSFETSIKTAGNLYTWISSGFFTTSGHSLGLGNSTHITMVPVGLGLKYFWKVKCTDVYAAVGVLPTYLHLHDSSDFVVQTTSKWGLGGVARIGALFDLPHSFYLDVFASYSVINVPNDNTDGGAVYPNSANLNGAAVGIGLGYRYGCR